MTTYVHCDDSSHTVGHFVFNGDILCAIWQFVYIGIRSSMCGHHSTSCWAEAVCRWSLDWHVSTSAAIADVRDSPRGNAWRRWVHIYSAVLLSFNIDVSLQKLNGRFSQHGRLAALVLSQLHTPSVTYGRPQLLIACSCLTSFYTSTKLEKVRNLKQVSLTATPSKCVPPLRLCSIHTLVHYHLDFWPRTLTTFSAIPTHMMNICGKFHWNPSTKYRDHCITQNMC